MAADGGRQTRCDRPDLALLSMKLNGPTAGSSRGPSVPRRRHTGAPPSTTEHRMSELLTQMRAGLTARHYSRRTEEAYCLWVRRYVRFHGLRHPAEHGRRGDQRLPHAPRRHGARQRLDPDAGPLRAALPLPPRARPRGRRARRAGPRQPAPTSAGGAHARGGAALLAGLEGDPRLMASLCTAPACASWSACACASRTSSRARARSSCATARAARTASPCCRAR